MGKAKSLEHQGRDDRKIRLPRGLAILWRAVLSNFAANTIFRLEWAGGDWAVFHRNVQADFNAFIANFSSPKALSPKALGVCDLRPQRQTPRIRVSATKSMLV
jgi:hypothetical protein